MLTPKESLSIKAKVDLRHKLECPNFEMDKLRKELLKIGGADTCAYKCWDALVTYITYLEGKLKRKDENFKRMKETIKNLEEMTK